MEALEGRVDELAASGSFSGVVRVDRTGSVVFARAYGLADRARGVPNTVDTRFGIASGTKLLTALVVVSLVDDGVLGLGTTARSLLGSALPLIDDDVTVEHLLAHRSGIGDYLDEDGDLDMGDHLLTVPSHRLVTTEDYLAVLDGYPMKFPVGSAFSYCNSGYVVLALLAERASGTSFHELVATRVCEPAGMTATAFLRSDEPSAGVAVGYLDEQRPRTNVFHLPARGTGDGGVHTTVGDVHALWRSFLAGAVVPRPWVARMLQPHSDAYGWGVWLDPVGGAVWIEGMDAGVSFRSVHRPADDVTSTVVSNTTDGAWPIARLLRGG